MRLNQFLAACGLGSRRRVEEIVASKTIEINGEPAEHPGIRVDPEQDIVTHNGQILSCQKKTYLMFNKPIGFICSRKSQNALPTIYDYFSELIKKNRYRKFSDFIHNLNYVGRLDCYSQGLLLLTNDGYLLQALTRPHFEISKLYRVEVSSIVDLELISEIKKPLKIGRAVTRIPQIRLVDVLDKKSILEIELTEGKNREIRRMIEQAGLKVTRLKRIELGGLKLGTLGNGQLRELTDYEVKQLKAQVFINN